MLRGRSRRPRYPAENPEPRPSVPLPTYEAFMEPLLRLLKDGRPYGSRLAQLLIDADYFGED